MKFSKWGRIVTAVINYQLITRLSTIIIVLSIGIIGLIDLIFKIDSLEIKSRNDVIERNKSLR